MPAVSRSRAGAVGRNKQPRTAAVATGKIDIDPVVATSKPVTASALSSTPSAWRVHQRFDHHVFSIMCANGS